MCFFVSGLFCCLISFEVAPSDDVLAAALLARLLRGLWGQGIGGRTVCIIIYNTLSA
jgi:hypothetical protein